MKVLGDYEKTETGPLRTRKIMLNKVIAQTEKDFK